MIQGTSFVKTVAVAVAVSMVCLSAGNASATNDENFQSMLTRTTGLFKTFDENALVPVVKQQFMLQVARAFYIANQKTAPASLKHEAALRVSDEDFEKWLANHWKDSGLANEPVDSAVLDNVTRIVLATLAPRSQFETAESNRVAKQLAENQYVGIGIQVRYIDDKAMIDEAFPGGAAFLAGAVKNDFILKVDGKSMVGLDLGEIIQFLRGPEGSEVSVVVQNQAADSEPRQLDMVRTVIPIPSVQGVKQNDDGSWRFMPLELGDSPEKTNQFAYLKICQVVGSTAAELKDAAAQILAAKATGVVLDLRELNSGELHQVNMMTDVLSEATSFGKLQVASGVTRELVSRSQSDFEGIPMVVLAPKQNVSGPVLALMVSLKHRENAQVLGDEFTSDLMCTASFDLPDNDGAIASLVYARLIPPGITGLKNERTDLLGHRLEQLSTVVHFAPDKTLDAKLDPMVQAVTELSALTD